MAPSATYDLTTSEAPVSFDIETIKSSIMDTPAPNTSQWPAHIGGPLAWKGDQFASEAEYIVTFTGSDITEIEHALASFKGKIELSVCRQ